MCIRDRRIAEGGRGGAEDGGRGQGGRAALEQPVRQRVQRHAERDADQRGQGEERRDGPAAEAYRRCGAGEGAVPGDAGPAAGPGLQADQQQGQRDQDQGEQGGRGGVEAELVLGEHGGGEGGVAQHREGAVLAEQVERDEQHAAGQCGPGEREGDPAQGGQPAAAERAGDLLRGGVAVPQGGRDRQEDQRVERAGHDQHRAPVAVDGAEQRDPGVAADELRYGQWQGERDRPGAAPGQGGAFDQVGGAEAEDGGGEGDGGGQAEGVPEQGGDQGAAEQPPRLVPTGLRGLGDDEAERCGDHRDDGGGEGREQAGGGGSAQPGGGDERANAGGPPPAQRGRAVGVEWEGHWSRPASCSRASACLPSPSWAGSATVPMPSRAGSSGLPFTPSTSGYS